MKLKSTPIPIDLEMEEKQVTRRDTVFDDDFDLPQDPIEESEPPAKKRKVC
jgi:hypothetical protein